MPATNPCDYATISVAPGQVVNADIQFDRVPGAPVLFNLGYGTGASSITADGSVVVGNYGRGGPVFKWTAKTGVEMLDDSLRAASRPTSLPMDATSRAT